MYGEVENINMAVPDMWIIVLAATTLMLFIEINSQGSTCDVNVPCSCCADGGVSCASNTNAYCEGPCMDGYYNIRCISPCPAECVSCHQSFVHANECFKCIDGRYGLACTEVCSNCLSCNKDTGVCFECAHGYYGQNCTNICSLNCVDRHCDMSGRCKGCYVGYYGDMCNDECSDKCQNALCDRTSGVCQQCINGYYGEYCNITCSQNCLDTCNMISGICTECKNGSYGKYCELNCSYSCREYMCDQITGTCITGCVENFQGNRCEDCTTGRHDILCDQNCPPNCLTGECNRNNGTCALGCKPGYSDSQFCCVNNTHCDQCSSQSVCTECTDGRYGHKCEHSCPYNCKGLCAKTSGNCDQCKLNYYGSRCENKCSLTCFATGDHISRCKPDNGDCTFGCVSGFYGNMCQLSCSEYCNGTCEQNAGECHSCKYNRYGKVCELLCFHACVKNESETVCNKITGSCVHGCVDGSYGYGCDKNCSTGCHNRSCDRHAGYCTNGCSEGFSGQFCMTDTQQAVTHTTLQTHSNDSSSFAVGVSFGIATAILIVGILVAVVLRKRIISMLSRRDLPQSSPTYEDLNTDLRTMDSAYSSVSYDNTNNDRTTQVYINTSIQQSSDASEPGRYVNLM